MNAPTRSGRGALRKSLAAAFSGVGNTIASQRNMKVHVLSALMVMIVGMALPLGLAPRVALLFAVAIVFFAEILNTGLEALVDLFIGDFHRLAMMAKDAAAGGVLVLAFVTVLILVEVLFTNWQLVTSHKGAVFHSVLFGVPLVVSEAVGLFWLRRSALALLRFLISLGLLVPLVGASEDPVYAFVALVLVLTAAYARHAYPARTGHGAPAT